MTKKNVTNLGRRKALSTLVASAAAIPFAKSIAEEISLTSSNITLMPNQKGPYDIVIKGGRVVDPETQLDTIANVGIIGEKIAAISEHALEGAKVIDAAGLIIAPGFVDLHAHGQQLPASRAQAFDGVTTQLEMESGLLPISKFYDDVAAEGRPINYGASVGWAFARVVAKEKNVPAPTGKLTWFQQAFSFSNWQNSIATPEELKHILDQVEQGLKEGGLGIGINAGYAPGYGHKEYYELAKLAKRYEVPTYTHVRYANMTEPKSSFEAYQELISLAATTDAHMHICHLNSTSIADIDICADMLQDAIERGLPITTEAYPYAAGSTAVGAEVFRGDDWLERWGVPSASYMELNGNPLSQAKIDDLQANNPGQLIVMHFLKPDDLPEDRRKLNRSVLFPNACIATDGMPWSDSKGRFIEGDVWPLPKDAFAHPRSIGSYARFIKEYVNVHKDISLTEALARTSLNACRIIENAVPQMKQKGRIQVGKDADIVVFDLEKIADKATYTDPVQLSEGFSHVIVNGKQVIENGEMDLTMMAGKPIRREVTV
ncbi:amidohydrolase family protein [Vibrio maritimus]|uniref:amidohydrolase family protein n=1 Tax=Vibrio maritimus TaxID=990268 RepID=UPI00373623B1